MEEGVGRIIHGRQMTKKGEAGRRLREWPPRAKLCSLWERGGTGGKTGSNGVVITRERSR